MTTAILFLFILALLVFVHELGHFLVAKASKIRVDEFGIGFPPKIFGKKYGETLYSFNWIPFGGFVKIFGENPDEESISGPDSARSFVNKNRGIQAGVLVAGVTFNVLFAWLLLSLGFMIGLPVSSSDYKASEVTNPQTTITMVISGSPAEKANLKTGDVITAMSAQGKKLAVISPKSIVNFIGANQDSKLTVSYTRGETTGSAEVVPESGISPDHKSIGVALDEVGILKLGLFGALGKGFAVTIQISKDIAVGFFNLISEMFQGKAKLDNLSGPIGIAKMVGDARTLGFNYLLTFTAFISINLAVLNLMPFPALDGGRLLFVAIEATVRRRISPKILNSVNAIGFALLIFLMVVVTYRDVIKLF